jgi:hypothetical protein
MMLELIMTRSQEKKIRDSIFSDLQYLVFDELHTYRGRQGVDVGMLIRRIKAQATQKIVCIGTSATMVSGGTIEDQKEKVAEVATTIFGSAFTSDQIVMEALANSFTGTTPTSEELTHSLQSEIREDASESDLLKHPLARWLERNIALNEMDGDLIRGKPTTILIIAKKLCVDASMPLDIAFEKLLQLLRWLSSVNQQKENQKYSHLPYRLHQFISQTGSVYATLVLESERFITLDPGITKVVGEKKLPLFHLVFSRTSGVEFICVTRDDEGMVMHPREFQEAVDEEDEQDLSAGYLISDLAIWNPDEDLLNLPESWGRVDRNGNFKPSKKHAKRLPQKVFYNDRGNFSTSPKYELSGWFMTSPLLFDPSSGTFFHGKTSESTKF